MLLPITHGKTGPEEKRLMYGTMDTDLCQCIFGLLFDTFLRRVDDRVGVIIIEGQERRNFCQEHRIDTNDTAV